MFFIFFKIFLGSQTVVCPRDFSEKFFCSGCPDVFVFFINFSSGQGGWWSTREIFLKKIFLIVIYLYFLIFPKKFLGQG